MGQKIRAIAVVERNNDSEVLLVKRNDTHSVRGYVLLGTKVEADRTPEQMLMNEYEKSTGIKIIIENLIAEKSSKYKRTMWYKAHPLYEEQKPMAALNLVFARYVPISDILTYITDRSILEGLPPEVVAVLKLIKPSGVQ